MSQKKVLMCGLPASGKTTFLAALWYLLFHNEVPTALSLVGLPEKRDYLNRLSYQWSRFIEIDHTAVDEVQKISLRLTDGYTELELHVPDMSGETWEAVWCTRSCAASAAEWAQDIVGIMLFLHADKIRLPVDVMTYKAMVLAAGETPLEGESAPWSPEQSPTQVMLVDILQALTMPPLGTVGRRLAVVISAWDKTDQKSTPDEYLQVHLPLLHQFLRCSDSFSEIKIFGISALGGDLQSGPSASRLKAEDVPSKRALVVEERDTGHDLTLPIRWLMG